MGERIAFVSDPARFRSLVTPELVFACHAVSEDVPVAWLEQSWVLAAAPADATPTRLERPLRALDEIAELLDADDTDSGTRSDIRSFWLRQDFPRDFGDGTVRDCLSVDISSWDSPGILFGKPATECTREEVTREVWAQLKAALEDTGDRVLPDELLHSSFLDPGVTGTGEGSPHNDDPLLIHPVGTWQKRPAAVTAIPNFFLAADYVRNDLDLATMEGANEAARSAVNGILEAAGSSQPHCRIDTLYRPPEFEPFKAQDAIDYRLGLPNVFDVIPSR